MVDNFKIEITCTECSSNNVETELTMNQGTGLLGIVCLDCGNDPERYLDDEALEIVVKLSNA